MAARVLWPQNCNAPSNDTRSGSGPTRHPANWRKYRCGWLWMADRSNFSLRGVLTKWSGCEGIRVSSVMWGARTSDDFWNGPNHYRPKRRGAGLPKLLEGTPVADGDCDRTSRLDWDAVEQESSRASPAGRAESPSGTHRSYDLNFTKLWTWIARNICNCC